MHSFSCARPGCQGHRSADFRVTACVSLRVGFVRVPCLYAQREQLRYMTSRPLAVPVCNLPVPPAHWLIHSAGVYQTRAKEVPGPDPKET